MVSATEPSCSRSLAPTRLRHLRPVFHSERTSPRSPSLKPGGSLKNSMRFSSVGSEEPVLLLTTSHNWFLATSRTLESCGVERRLNMAEMVKRSRRYSKGGRPSPSSDCLVCRKAHLVHLGRWGEHLISRRRLSFSCWDHFLPGLAVLIKWSARGTMNRLMASNFCQSVRWDSRMAFESLRMPSASSFRPDPCNAPWKVAVSRVAFWS